MAFAYNFTVNPFTIHTFVHSFIPKIKPTYWSYDSDGWHLDPNHLLEVANRRAALVLPPLSYSLVRQREPQTLARLKASRGPAIGSVRLLVCFFNEFENELF